MKQIKLLEESLKAVEEEEREAEELMNRLTETFGAVENTIKSNEILRKSQNEESERDKQKFRDQVMARIAAKKDNSDMVIMDNEDNVSSHESNLSKVDLAKLQLVKDVRRTAKE